MCDRFVDVGFDVQFTLECVCCNCCLQRFTSADIIEASNEVQFLEGVSL